MTNKQAQDTAVGCFFISIAAVTFVIAVIALVLSIVAL
jgi:hypothetical protein